MRVQRITFTALTTLALVVGFAGTSGAEDYNQGDDTPGCTPYVSGPVLPNSCGAGQPNPTQPNEGRPNGAGGWLPDCNGTTITYDCGGEQLPEEVIGRQYDNGCYQQTVEHVYCPEVAPVTEVPVAPSVSTAPSAKQQKSIPEVRDTTFTGTNTYL